MDKTREENKMKKRVFSAILTLCLLLTMMPTVAFAADELPNLTDPETSGISGGVDWKIKNDTLTISPSATPEDGYGKGQMVENYKTFEAPNDDYKNALIEAGYEPSESNGHHYFHYKGTNTWVSDSPWKFSCDKVTKVVIEDGVTNIGQRAFRLPNIKEVSIPASVESIGYLAFEACGNLETINWTGDWKNHVGMTYESFVSRCAKLGSDLEFTEWLPECFTAMGGTIEDTLFTVDLTALNERMTNQDDAVDYKGEKLGGKFPSAMLQRMPNIKQAEIIDKYNSSTFRGTGLTQVTFAGSVTEISSSMFEDCTDLTSIEIPESITSIRSAAFRNSGLRQLDFKGNTCPNIQNGQVFNGVKLDRLGLNQNMSMSEAVKVISALKKVGAVTEDTVITPNKFAAYDTDNLTIDGSEGEEINQTNYPAVKNLTINGGYISKVGAFGGSIWGNQTVKTLIIDAPGGDVTINGTTFLRAPLESVKISANTLTFTGDAAFLNNMLLTHVDLSDVNDIVVTSGGGRTFEINKTNNGNCLTPVRYVYFKNINAYNAIKNHFLGNTDTYYLVTNGGTCTDVTADKPAALSKADYIFDGWYEQENCSGNEVTTLEKGKVYYAKWVECNHQNIYYTVKGNVITEACGCGKISNTVTLNAPSDLTYDGQKKECMITKSDAWRDTSDLKIEYYAGDKKLDEAPVNAGNYTAKVTVRGVTASVDFTIEKYTYEMKLEANPATMTGAGTVELTVSDIPVNENLKVTCDNDITVTEKEGKYTAELPNTTKEYTFTAAYAGDKNHNEATATCRVSVTRRSSGGSSSTTNTVSASTALDGKVTMDKSSAKKGDTVTITVTPDAGYELGKLTVTDAKGNTIATTKKDDNKYTFTMPDGKVTVTPTFTKIAEEKPSASNYVDVASSAWYADAVKYVADKGLMSGTGDKKFSPNASTTRGMLMTVLARYAGKDTAGSTPWYQAGMDWAKENGVSDGTKPTENITREQLVTMLYRSAGSPAASGSLDNFSDSASVSGYAVNAMKWAVANGIVNGSNGKLNPKNNATRAEVAAILMRFCEKTEK